MSTLHVQVFSGLGSRMRAVIGGIAWCRANFATLNIHWVRREPSEDLGTFPAWYSDLFELPPHGSGTPWIVESRDREPGPPWPKQISLFENGWRIRSCDPIDFAVNSMDLSGWPYCDLWKPSKDVREQIESVAPRWPGPPVFGVHIRQALAQPTTPPVAWFLARMRELHDRYACRFYLACDAPEVEQE